MFLPIFSVILGHPNFASCHARAQRVLAGPCKVLAMHLDVYAGVTIKTKTCPIGHLKPVCSATVSIRKFIRLIWFDVLSRKLIKMKDV